MSSLRKLMSQLKISKDESQNSQKKENKNLFLKSGFSYKVRFLPYIGNDGMPNIIKHMWYHFVDGAKIDCSSKSCVHCDNNVKKNNQKFTNIKLIESDDAQYNRTNSKDYFIFTIPYDFYQFLDNYEKNNSVSLFDVFGAPEVVLKPTNFINNYGNSQLSFTDSFVCSEVKPISDNIADFSDEDIIAYLEEFTYNLDEEVKSMFVMSNEEIEPQARVINTKIKQIDTKTKVEVQESRNETMKSSINTMINNLDDIELDLDEGIKVEDLKVVVEPIVKKEVKVKEVKKQTIVPKIVEDNIDDFINDFMNEIED